MKKYSLQKVASIAMGAIMATVIGGESVSAYKEPLPVNDYSYSNNDDCDSYYYEDSCNYNREYVTKGDVKLYDVVNKRYVTNRTNVYVYYENNGDRMEEHWTRDRKGNDEALLVEVTYYGDSSRVRTRDIYFDNLVYNTRDHVSCKIETDKKFGDYYDNDGYCNEDVSRVSGEKIITLRNIKTGECFDYYTSVNRSYNYSGVKYVDEYYFLECDGDFSSLVLQQCYTSDSEAYFVVKLDGYEFAGEYGIRDAENSWSHNNKSYCNDDCIRLVKKMW